MCIACSRKTGATVIVRSIAALVLDVAHPLLQTVNIGAGHGTYWLWLWLWLWLRLWLWERRGRLAATNSVRIADQVETVAVCINNALARRAAEAAVEVGAGCAQIAAPIQHLFHTQGLFRVV